MSERMTCACQGDERGNGFNPCGLHAMKMREAGDAERNRILGRVRRGVEAMPAFLTQYGSMISATEVLNLLTLLEAP